MHCDVVNSVIITESTFVLKLAKLECYCFIFHIPPNLRSFFFYRRSERLKMTLRVSKEILTLPSVQKIRKFNEYINLLLPPLYGWKILSIYLKTLSIQSIKQSIKQSINQSSNQSIYLLFTQINYKHWMWGIYTQFGTENIRTG